MKKNYVFTFYVVMLAMSSIVAVGQGSKADYDRAMSLDKRTRDKVFRSKVNPHWLPDGDSFWYRVEVRPGKKENVLVDAVKGIRKPSFSVPPEKALASQSANVSRRSASKGDDTSVVFHPRV